jgi:peptide/nickel transport system permease protein
MTLLGKPRKGDGAPPDAAKKKDSRQQFDKQKMAALSVKEEIMLSLRPRLRELRFSLHLMSKSLTSIIGGILLAILVVIAAFPYLFAEPEPGSDPYTMPFDTDQPDPQPPGSDDHLLGSGKNGADIYYGIIWGARLSMSFAIYVISVSLAIGMMLGLLAGYKGGVIDEIVMRVTDVFLSIPSLILVMAIAAVLGKDLRSTLVALMCVWWSGYTRLIRGQVLSVRENVYVDAARASGASEWRIMFKHILPNSWAPIIVQSTMDMGSVVLVMAGLSFLGLGAQSGTAEWGKMIFDGQQFMVLGYWWMVVFPGLAILMFVMAFNLMGDGLRDIMDPKMRR